jgi:hypothetical protein
MQTVPYLIDNPEVGYVQARWVFANPDESYLTKAQEISLNFHCKCEQFVHFASGSFFNFNGTAGARIFLDCPNYASLDLMSSLLGPLWLGLFGRGARQSVLHASLWVLSVYSNVNALLQVHTLWLSTCNPRPMPEANALGTT